MAAKKLLIVGNWKMHLTVSEASLLLHRLNEKIKGPLDGVEVVLCPPALAVQPLSLQIDHKKFSLGMQNVYHQDEGAFTGEISAAQVRDLVTHVIVGHSERRHIFGESDELISQKVAACLRHNLKPILCVGETLVERSDGETKRVLHDQLVTGLNLITAEDIMQVTLAYEPVWAISSGTDFADHAMPKPDEIEQAAAHMRKVVEQLHDKKTAKAVHILYGGSTHADLAKGYLRVPGISGFLVGGASLNYDQFSRIVNAAKEEANG